MYIYIFLSDQAILKVFLQTLWTTCLGLQFIFMSIRSCTQVLHAYVLLSICRQEELRLPSSAAALQCSAGKCMASPGNDQHVEALPDDGHSLALIETDQLSYSPSRLQTATVLPHACKLCIFVIGCTHIQYYKHCRCLCLCLVLLVI